MNTKKMTYILLAALLCGFIYTGWKLTSRNAYESAEYSVLESDGNFELRSYPELMLATTSMGTRIQGDDGSFGRLFQYISGGNDAKQKVAMTTPVFMEPDSADANGQMSFVVPKKLAESKIPEPTHGQVQITKRPAGKFAVVRFNGRLNSKSRDQQLSNLQSWVEAKGYETTGEAEFAGYDPPWTPGPLRRNEILIRIGS